MVGGTLATNASGARSFKYGATRRYVKRVRIALPTGELADVVRGARTLARGRNAIELGGRVIEIALPSYRMPEVKNAAGYYAKDGMDLVDLFIGHEGTLGVIVEAEIGLVRKPEKILSAFAFFGAGELAWSFAAGLRNASRAAAAGSAIDALSIEYFDPNALKLLGAKCPNVPAGASEAIFVEQEAARGREDALIEEWLRLISRNGGSPDDTWVAMTDAEVAGFNAFRYSIPESVNDIVRRNGFRKLSADIAVPEANFHRMMRFYRDSLEGSGLDRVLFGHIGECHVHANLLPRSDRELAEAKELMLAFVKEGVRLGGTVSAEHGIGKIKHEYLREMYGAGGVAEMARVKKAFDPNCVLNLDNVFPKELLSEA
jgi:D-lactate dehydrogenase (cytochrome)